MDKKKLLIVDDEKPYARSLAFALRKDFETSTAYTYDESVRILKKEAIDAALLDVRLQEDDETNQDGLRILQWLKKNQPHVHGFMMTSYKDMGYQQEAVKLGTEHFFEKPIDILQMRRILKEKVG